jgi:hypothetical protein
VHHVENVRHTWKPSNCFNGALGMLELHTCVKGKSRLSITNAFNVFIFLISDQYFSATCIFSRRLFRSSFDYVAFGPIRPLSILLVWLWTFSWWSFVTGLAWRVFSFSFSVAVPFPL